MHVRLLFSDNFPICKALSWFPVKVLLLLCVMGLFIYYVVLGGKRYNFFGNFDVRTKWMIHIRDRQCVFCWLENSEKTWQFFRMFLSVSSHFVFIKFLEALTLMLLACNFIGKRSSGTRVFVRVLQKFWKQLFSILYFLSAYKGKPLSSMTRKFRLLFSRFWTIL